MIEYTMYSEKENTLYINSDVILPDTKGMPFREHCKAYDNAFKMSYEKRLEAFCPENIRKEIQAKIDSHPGCILSEFCDPGVTL